MKHILQINLSVIVINLTYKIELNEMARILIIFNVSFNRQDLFTIKFVKCLQILVQ